MYTWELLLLLLLLLLKGEHIDGYLELCRRPVATSLKLNLSVAFCMEFRASPYSVFLFPLLSNKGRWVDVAMVSCGEGVVDVVEDGPVSWGRVGAREGE